MTLGQPAGPLMTRQANSFSTITQQLDFAGTPGALSYEIKYAKGGVLQADGSISSPALQDGFLDRATGKVQIAAREPGDYVVVARAKNGDYYTPWSAPITMKLIAPFDLASRRFPDQRGPRYQVRGELREVTAGGRVTVAAASGKNGKKFRTLGKGKVNSKGIFKLNFTIRKRGATVCATHSRARRRSRGARSTRSCASAACSAERAGRIGSRVRGRGCR